MVTKYQVTGLQEEQARQDAELSSARSSLQSLAYNLARGRVRWAGKWIGGFYPLNDMVYDDGWTMIVNNPDGTNDRAAPQAVDDPAFLSGFGDAPPWLTPVVNGRVLYTGQRYTAPAGQGFFLSGYRVWIPIVDASTIYEIWLVTNASGAIPTIVKLQSGFVPEDAGWFTIRPGETLIGPGVIFDLILVKRAAAIPTNFSGNWNVRNTNGDPSFGDMNFQSNSIELRFSKTDNDSIDQSSNLESIPQGATIAFAGTIWVVGLVGISASHVTYGVIPNQGRPSAGIYNCEFDYGALEDIEYVHIVDHYLPSSGAVKGFIK